MARPQGCSPDRTASQRLALNTPRSDHKGRNAIGASGCIELWPRESQVHGLCSLAPFLPIVAEPDLGLPAKSHRVKCTRPTSLQTAAPFSAEKPLVAAVPQIPHLRMCTKPPRRDCLQSQFALGSGQANRAAYHRAREAGVLRRSRGKEFQTNSAGKSGSCNWACLGCPGDPSWRSPGPDRQAPPLQPTTPLTFRTLSRLDSAGGARFRAATRADAAPGPSAPVSPLRAPRFGARILRDSASDEAGRLKAMSPRYVHLEPEKLGAVASRIERQPLAGPTGELRGRNVRSVTTFPLRSINQALGKSAKPLIEWRARRDSNSRPSGS